MMRPLPLPLLRANGEEIQVRQFDGDFSIFEGATVLCSIVLDVIDANFIAALPDSVKLIANIGTGYDHIDIDAATDRGIRVTNTPVVAEDTADLTFLLILASARQLTANQKFLRAGHWTSTQQPTQIGKTVHGTTLGIIGFGEIGQAVARRAKSFNMNVIYHGPRRKRAAEERVGATYFKTLEDMLATADIVSLHCPLTEQTKHIINAETLSAMKSDAVLVNTGRGALIDEAAFVDAMKAGHLSGAGLDVFEHEPDMHPGLLELDNITLTPHIGAATAQCHSLIGACAIENILAQFEGRELISCVNPH
tara:strand:+ start:932 stop:1855 length:924 start_codon:yes stop_codon:yes gene_type:complete